MPRHAFRYAVRWAFMDIERRYRRQTSAVQMERGVVVAGLVWRARSMLRVYCRFFPPLRLEFTVFGRSGVAALTPTYVAEERQFAASA